MELFRHLFVLAIFVGAGVIGSASQSIAQEDSSRKGQNTPAVAKALPADIDPESLTRLPLVKREDLDEYGKKVYDMVTSSDPRYKDGVPGPPGMWMYDPVVAEHLFPIRNYIRTKIPLGQRFVELAILVTSRELDSQFEWTAHESIGRAAGLTEEVIEVVKYRQDPSKLGDKEALIIRFGRELIGERKVRSDTFAQALKVFGKQGVMDLTATMGLYQFINTTTVAFDGHRPPGQPGPSLPRLPGRGETH